MTTLALIFLLGGVAGLRAMTAPATVCWAAHLGWLHVEGTKLAFLGHPSTLILVTLLAVGELIGDKLPNTPARTAPLGLTARILLGGACGAAVAFATGISVLGATCIAATGALGGAFSGYHFRHALTSQLHLPDTAVALAEDAVAVVGGLLIVSHM